MERILDEFAYRIDAIMMFTAYTLFKIMGFMALWISYVADTVMNGKEKPLFETVQKNIRYLYVILFKRR